MRVVGFNTAMEEMVQVLFLLCFLDSLEMEIHFCGSALIIPPPQFGTKAAIVPFEVVCNLLLPSTPRHDHYITP